MAVRRTLLRMSSTVLGWADTHQPLDIRKQNGIPEPVFDDFLGRIDYAPVEYSTVDEY